MDYFVKVIKLDDKTTKSKNRALKEALKSPYDYFFLIEDNCKILDENIYNKFIDTCEKTGIQALMWGEGGLNKKLDFDDDPNIYYYSDFATAFTMYTRTSIEKVGLMDEVMPANTWQELEHSKKIGDAGLSTPFGMNASPKGVDGMLELTYNKMDFVNIKAMDEALTYWAEKEGEEFPIEIAQKPKEKIMQML